jgi:hypothetical protein
LRCTAAKEIKFASWFFMLRQSPGLFPYTIEKFPFSECPQLGEVCNFAAAILKFATFIQPSVINKRSLKLQNITSEVASYAYLVLHIYVQALS